MKYAVLCVEKQNDTDVQGYLVYDQKERAVHARTAIETLNALMSEETLQDFVAGTPGDVDPVYPAYVEAFQAGTNGFTEYGPVSVFEGRKNLEIINWKPVRIHYWVTNFDPNDYFVSSPDEALKRLREAFHACGNDIRNADRLDMIWGIVHAEEEFLEDTDREAYYQLRQSVDSWSKSMVPFDGECMGIVKTYLDNVTVTA